MSEPLKESSSEYRDAMLSRLWERMAEIYGHRWTSAYGLVASENASWAAGIASLTGQQIAKGLSELVKAGDEWPPSLPAFLRLCQPEKTQALHRMFKALPAPAADPKVAKEALAECWKILGGNKPS